MQGPNVRKLIVRRMSSQAIPPGGGLADAVKFLSSKDTIIGGARAATEWVKLAIAAVRQAAEPNQFKSANDEEIAAEILRQISESPASGANKNSKLTLIGAEERIQ
jgi:hypothetical protein